MPKERTQVTFEQFKGALRVFNGDYGIVGHAGLPTRLPWEEPNESGVYSLTQIPENMTEEEFLVQIKETTDIVITCMDKDCAHSTWEQLKKPGKQVLMLSWAGGVVQDVLEDGTDRVTAHNLIARYFGGLKENGQMQNLDTVHAADHDSVCGAVKKFLGVELHMLLSKWFARDINAHSPEEDMVMEALVRDGAQPWVEEFAGAGVKVMAELHYTDREHPENSKITQIDLGPGKSQMNVAALKQLNSLGI